MKIELPDKLPENFKENWPGQYNVFSHYETLLGIPHTLFVITTLKENGLPNASYCGWSSFSGDGGGFYAIVPIMSHTHTVKNILRDKQFVINFISYEHDPKCWETIKNNSEDADELAVAGFHVEKSTVVNAPRISEAFMSLECTLHSEQDLSGIGVTSLVIGRVCHAAVEEGFLNGVDKYGKDGFMLYLNDLLDFSKGNETTRRYASLNLLD
jgi:flavin reductase (DIM6/NTAB) family NADH-FMN oxidoreductase RutF